MGIQSKMIKINENEIKAINIQFFEIINVNLYYWEKISKIHQ